MNFQGNTFQKLVEHWAVHQPDKDAFIQLTNDHTDSITYKDLFLKSLALAKELKNHKSRSRCVLTMYPTGIDFVIAFFACVLSGNIAVPVHMPKGNRANEKIKRIIDDCDIDIVLTVKDGVELIKSNSDYENLSSDILLLSTEDYYTSEFEDDSFLYDYTSQEEDIVFLQYTSGSTSFPKGVEIRNKNLLYNLQMLQKAFEMTNDSIVGSWLPHFHDMGLIGCYLNAFYNGATCIIMSPLMFMKNPVLWLKMITDYKVTVSGGPNFAYDYCVDKIKEEQLKDIDLSSWQLAFNGAEPISYDTLVNFNDKFKHVGFEFKNFYPAYGMAEACVFVSGNKKSEEPKAIYVDYKELSKNTVKKLITGGKEKNAVSLVCCGRSWLEQEIRIVNPHTKEELKENEIGEICISGGNITYGYWKKDEVNKEKFFTVRDGSEEKRFYMTGDMGFYCDNDLYITGRKDDVIIINGVNVYPQDIEKIVEKTLPEVKKGAVCAFDILNNNKREIVVLAELQRAYAARLKQDDEYFKDITDAIRQNITNEFDFQISSLAFLSLGSTHKTSSGKICRKQNKEHYLSKTISIIREWKCESDMDNTKASNSKVNCFMETFEKVNAAGFMQFKVFSSIVKLLSKEDNLNIMDLDINRSLFFYGIDSLKIFDIHVALEKEYDVKIPTEIFFNSSNLLTVLNRIADVLEDKRIHSVETSSVRLLDEIKKYEGIISEKLLEVGNRIKPEMSYEKLNNIFLTGAAGFVGGYILKECLEKTKADVYCLVRAKNEQHGMERIINNLAVYNLELDNDEKNRVKIVIGDISKDDLGFGSNQYKELSEINDLVIHCAAIDNFYLPYSSLKAANVDGVKNMMMFSLNGKVKPMFYTASCSASLIDDNMNSNQLIGIINGYSQTKYVAQELLLNSIKKGFPGVSIKLGYLYADEPEVVHPQEGFESLIASVYNMGLVPEMDADFDLTSVEYVADVITDMALNYPSNIKDHYILYNPKPLSWKDVIVAFNKLECDIKQVPLNEFIDKFQEYVHDSGIASLKFVSRVITNRLEEQFNKMFRSVNYDSFDKYIHRCPPCDEHFVEHYIDMVIRYAISDRVDTKKVYEHNV